jgi:hypothetical protein
MTMRVRDPLANSTETQPPVGRIAAPQEVPGANPAFERDEDPSGNDVLTDKGRDRRSPADKHPEKEPGAGVQGDVRGKASGREALHSDERLAKDLEGLEVDEPDPSFEEKQAGA